MNTSLPDNSRFCCYCGIEFNNLNARKQLTKDHLIPLSKGGANNTYNKRNCCCFCNTQKGKLLPHDYLAYLEHLYGSAINASTQYDLSIRIENVKYVIEYVNTAGEKLFRKKDGYKWFKKRYLKIAY